MATPSTTLQVGDAAPDHELLDQHGNLRRLSDIWKAGPLVIYFYPRDETPGCTAQACSFRDSFEDFQQVGAQVVGVSSDDAESHRKFAEHHRLPFMLLSDTQEVLRKRYGVKSTLGFIPGRVTFVIDREGRVRHMFSSQLRATAHIGEALDVLRTLA